ncbi:cell division protein FtsB [Buchnera aphidicola (Melanaphis sacchari)]|uniref:Cell division protein FtsB n=1 Tax=Buchnera aphidicola (Melanaphis sacchari) TaxID=2173854 RepID=A0A2U8DEW9_9GAMM|nr:septum formation initiator family protein [Buchnera aphidicola]AWH90379.1 cell division protein FtsB [Buchnera aphidicola (Melanaphis sacchari)]
MKILKIFLFFLLFLLQYSLWIGKNGILEYISIYKKIIIQKKKNKEIEEKNNQLILEIQRLNDKIKNCKDKSCIH